MPVRPLAAIAFCAVFIVAGCQRVFVVSVEGTITAGPVFVLEGVGLVPKTFRVVEVLVQQQQSDVWVTMWHLKGVATTERLAYGQAPDRMSAIVEARELSLSGRYRIEVFEDPHFGGRNRAMTNFGFDTNGRAIEIDPPRR